MDSNNGYFILMLINDAVWIVDTVHVSFAYKETYNSLRVTTL